MIGKTISHYEIVKKLGMGGMGVVYKAHDTKLKRTVALKFLPPQLSSDPEAKERFIHEAQAASALDHPNICTIHEIGETESGESYIAMACYDGESLKLKIENCRLKIDESIDFAIQIAKGLQKAHERGIIHRDIKPANIMITDDGTAKILDFGLAKLAGQTRLTKTGSTVGTAAYMSPEQAKGEPVDQRTDIWSLGVILYEMVTGELPFKGDYDQAVVYSILNELPESMDRVPVELKEIIEIALAKNPDERYQEIGQLIADLKVLKDESESSQRMISHRDSLKRKRFKKLSKYVIYPVLFVVVLLAGYFANQTLSSKEIEPVPIAVISFKNQTGDPAYDNLRNVIPNLLITDLDQSRFFQVNSWERMRDLLEQMGQGDKEYIELDEGIQIAQKDNIPAIISGSFVIIGDMFSIDVKVLDTKTKDILKSARSSGEGENSILRSQIDDLSEQIATAIDLPPREFVKTKRPIIEVSTTSLEAYKYYLLGRENRDAFRWNEAQENFAKAILLDSTFAMAHLYLYHISSKDPHLDMAKKYRDKTTHKEQVILDFLYAWYKGNEIIESVRELKRAISLYPNEKEIYFNLADYYAIIKGEIDTGIVFYEKVLDLDPNYRWALNNLGFLYAEKGDSAKTLEYLQRYVNFAPDESNPYDSMGEVYLIMNDLKKSIEMYEKALQIYPNAWAYTGIAANYIKMGKYQRARDQLNEGFKITKSYNDLMRIHLFQAMSYVAEGDLENTLKEMEIRGTIAKQNSDSVDLAMNHLDISEILFENDRIKEAEERLAVGKRLIEISDISESNNYRLWRVFFWLAARLAVKNGNMDQAKEYAEMYKKKVEKNKNPNMPNHYYLKIYFTLSSLIAYAKENFEKAISDLKQSNLDYHGWYDNADVSLNRYLLALVYEKTGDRSKGIDLLKSVINYNDTARIQNELLRFHAKKQLAMLVKKMND